MAGYLSEINPFSKVIKVALAFYINCLPAEDSHEISSLFLPNMKEYVIKFVIHGIHYWHFKGRF